ncbi:TPA: DUF87 domain-containing protein [Clostridioides difficile]|nr:DUF87 domain-containing protein [Clostridioides difficile]
MSSNNLLSPLIDSLWDVCTLIVKTILKESDKFNFDYFFDCVNLKNKLNEKPTLLKQFEREYFNSYIFNLPVGLTLENFISHQQALEQQLNSKVEIILKDKRIIIKQIKVSLNEKVPYQSPSEIDKKMLRIPVGDSLRGIEYIYPGKVPHTLITGSTGSGKSVCTKSILTSLINMYTEKEMEIILIDFKIVELSLFKECKQVRSYINEVEDATEIIKDLLLECRKRYALFQQYNVTNITDYNKNAKKKMKMQFIFIEEFVMFSEEKKGMKTLRKLASLSRASGQYIFFSCQRADNTVVDNVFKANVGNRICFRTEDSKNSLIAIDKEGAERLNGNGHALLKVGSNLTEIQGYYASDDEINKLIKKFKIEKKAPALNTDAQVENKKNKLDCNKIYDISFLDRL